MNHCREKPLQSENRCQNLSNLKNWWENPLNLNNWRKTSDKIKKMPEGFVKFEIMAGKIVKGKKIILQLFKFEKLEEKIVEIKVTM